LFSATVALRLDESTLFARARASLNEAWLSSMENVPAASEVEVVQVMVSEPSETAFPVTDEMERADAKGAASARIAQSLNMANICECFEVGSGMLGGGGGEEGGEENRDAGTRNR